MANRAVYFETFLNYLDAMHWLETQLMEHKEDNLIEAKLYYTNGAWAVAIMFGDGNIQMELDIG